MDVEIKASVDQPVAEFVGGGGPGAEPLGEVLGLVISGRALYSSAADVASTPVVVEKEASDLVERILLGHIGALVTDDCRYLELVVEILAIFGPKHLRPDNERPTD